MTARGSADVLRSGERPDGYAYIAVLAKRAYRLRHDARATPMDHVPSFVEEPVYAESLNPGADRRLVADSDNFCIAKPLTDVLLAGSAFSHDGPQRKVDTRLHVGPVDKTVRVWGRRRIAVHGDQARLTEPEPFTERELTWDHAFGGRDREAERLEARAPRRRHAWRPGERPPEGISVPGSLQYPRNAAGRGYLVGGALKRLDGQEAPMLEDPGDPITADRLAPRPWQDWAQLPVAAGYGPIDALTFPRAQFVMPLVEAPVREVTLGALGAEHLVPPSEVGWNPRVCNCAPAGLAVARLRGDEAFRLENLHAERASIDGALPGDVPRVHVDLPGVGARALEPLLATVLFEPAENRVTMTWAATIRVLMPYSTEQLASVRHALTWSL